METLRRWMLPIAMLIGAVFHDYMGHLTFLSPYLIFTMLTVTYCRLNPRDFRIGGLQWSLLAAQALLCGLAYAAALPLGQLVASGVFLCVFMPTATAAPVITSMLGGSLTHVVTYSLASNLAAALTGPVILASIGSHPDMTFMQAFYMICSHVVPLLLAPLVLALILRYSCPKVCRAIAGHQSLSFYLWAVSLVIVVGSSVSFLIQNYTHEHLADILWLVGGALLVCLVQFAIGRSIGRRFRDAVAGGQGLGQKNTVLGIWLALAYLNPLASVAPAAYVAWQNIINSWQIWHHRRGTSQREGGV